MLSVLHGRRHGALLVAVAGCLLLAAGCGPREPKWQPVETSEAKVGQYGAWTAISPAGPPLNVLLITLDTTRRDRFSCYGYDKQTTPNLDRLAADGLIFDRAVTPVPITLPAHASILTGMYPFQHGIRNNGTYVLADRFQTMAELLRGRGYATGAVVAGFPLDERFGLAQGFDQFDDEFPIHTVSEAEDTAQRPGSDVTRLGIRWLDEHLPAGADGRPFFLWLHYYDPHTPYAPPEPFASAFPGDPYTGEIASMDAAIGAVLDALRERGAYDRTLILVVGDHGESLGEHGEQTHSIFIYQATQRVPLILRLPPAAPFEDAAWRGRRIPNLVCLVDCLPTVLQALGWAREEVPPTSGRSLLAVAQGEDPGHRWVYHETLVPMLAYAWSDLRGIETDGWKYIRAPRPELYDLRKDPDELVNLAEKEPERRDAFERDLAAIARLDPGARTGEVTLDQETIEKLRSLGYLGGAAAPAPSGPLPDPKDMIAVYEQVNLARSLVAQGRPGEALSVLDSLRTESPDALRIRASSLVRLGRGEEGIQAYDDLLARFPDSPERIEILEGRAMAALVARKLDDALTRTEDLIAAVPQRPNLRTLLGRVHEARGDQALALAALQEEVRLFPRSVPALVALAAHHAAFGSRSDAEAAYRQALALSPNSADALSGLAEMLAAAGRFELAQGYVEEALRHDPRHPDALFRRAWLLGREGKAREAMEAYQRLLRRDPTHPAGLYNAGKLCLDAGDTSAARLLLERALAVGWDKQELRAALGLLEAQAGNLPAAIDHWERAVALNPKSAEAAGLRNNLAMARARLAGAGSPR